MEAAQKNCGVEGCRNEGAIEIRVNDREYVLCVHHRGPGLTQLSKGAAEIRLHKLPRRADFCSPKV